MALTEALTMLDLDGESDTTSFLVSSSQTGNRNGYNDDDYDEVNDNNVDDTTSLITPSEGSRKKRGLIGALKRQLSVQSSTSSNDNNSSSRRHHNSSNRTSDSRRFSDNNNNNSNNNTTPQNTSSPEPTKKTMNFVFPNVNVECALDHNQDKNYEGKNQRRPLLADEPRENNLVGTASGGGGPPKPRSPQPQQQRQQQQQPPPQSKEKRMITTFTFRTAPVRHAVDDCEMMNDSDEKSSLDLEGLEDDEEKDSDEESDSDSNTDSGSEEDDDEESGTTDKAEHEKLKTKMNRITKTMQQPEEEKNQRRMRFDGTTESSAHNDIGNRTIQNNYQDDNDDNDDDDRAEESYGNSSVWGGHWRKQRRDLQEQRQPLTGGGGGGGGGYNNRAPSTRNTAAPSAPPRLEGFGNKASDSQAQQRGFFGSLRRSRHKSQNSSEMDAKADGLDCMKVATEKTKDEMTWQESVGQALAIMIAPEIYAPEEDGEGNLGQYGFVGQEPASPRHDDRSNNNLYSNERRSGGGRADSENVEYWKNQALTLRARVKSLEKEVRSLDIECRSWKFRVKELQQQMQGHGQDDNSSSSSSEEEEDEQEVEAEDTGVDSGGDVAEKNGNILIDLLGDATKIQQETNQIVETPLIDLGDEVDRNQAQLKNEDDMILVEFGNGGSGENLGSTEHQETTEQQECLVDTTGTKGEALVEVNKEHPGEPFVSRDDKADKEQTFVEVHDINLKSDPVETKEDAPLTAVESKEGTTNEVKMLLDSEVTYMCDHVSVLNAGEMPVVGKHFSEENDQVLIQENTTHCDVPPEPEGDNPPEWTEVLEQEDKMGEVKTLLDPNDTYHDGEQVQLSNQESAKEEGIPHGASATEEAEPLQTECMDEKVKMLLQFYANADQSVQIMMQETLRQETAVLQTGEGSPAPVGQVDALQTHDNGEGVRMLLDEGVAPAAVSGSTVEGHCEQVETENGVDSVHASTSVQPMPMGAVDPATVSNTANLETVLHPGMNEAEVLSPPQHTVVINQESDDASELGEFEEDEEGTLGETMESNNNSTKELDANDDDDDKEETKPPVTTTAQPTTIRRGFFTSRSERLRKKSPTLGDLDDVFQDTELDDGQSEQQSSLERLESVLESSTGKAASSSVKKDIKEDHNSEPQKDTEECEKHDDSDDVNENGSMATKDTKVDEASTDNKPPVSPFGILKIRSVFRGRSGRKMPELKQEEDVAADQKEEKCSDEKGAGAVDQDDNEEVDKTENDSAEINEDDDNTHGQPERECDRTDGSIGVNVGMDEKSCASVQSSSLQSSSGVVADDAEEMKKSERTPASPSRLVRIRSVFRGRSSGKKVRVLEPTQTAVPDKKESGPGKQQDEANSTAENDNDESGDVKEGKETTQNDNKKNDEHGKVENGQVDDSDVVGKEEGSVTSGHESSVAGEQVRDINAPVSPASSVTRSRGLFTSRSERLRKKSPTLRELDNVFLDTELDDSHDDDSAVHQAGSTVGNKTGEEGSLADEAAKEKNNDDDDDKEASNINEQDKEGNDRASERMEGYKEANASAPTHDDVVVTDGASQQEEKSSAFGRLRFRRVFRGRSGRTVSEESSKHHDENTTNEKNEGSSDERAQEEQDGEGKDGSMDSPSKEEGDDAMMIRPDENVGMSEVGSNWTREAPQLDDQSSSSHHDGSDTPVSSPSTTIFGIGSIFGGRSSSKKIMSDQDSALPPKEKEEKEEKVKFRKDIHDSMRQIMDDDDDGEGADGFLPNEASFEIGLQSLPPQAEAWSCKQSTSEAVEEEEKEDNLLNLNQVDNDSTKWAESSSSEPQEEDDEEPLYIAV